jgi:hypothetical protein
LPREFRFQAAGAEARESLVIIFSLAASRETLNFHRWDCAAIPNSGKHARWAKQQLFRTDLLGADRNSA